MSRWVTCFLTSSLIFTVLPSAFTQSISKPIPVQKAEFSIPFDSIKNTAPAQKAPPTPSDEKILPSQKQTVVIPYFSVSLQENRLKNRPLPAEKLLTKAEFESLFPIKNNKENRYPSSQNPYFYSYENFLAASQYFPYFLNEGTIEDKYRELAAFLAHISYETGARVSTKSDQNWWDYGLLWIEELPNTKGERSSYQQDNAKYPYNPQKSYHGRGPIQITWNYNYGALSEFLFDDKTILLNHPEFISQSGTLAFMSALWFWMTPQKPKPSSHDIMVGNVILNTVGKINYPLTGPVRNHSVLSIGRNTFGQTQSYYDWQVPPGFSVGFGATISIIHGNREVGHTFIGYNQALRIAFYARYLDIFGRKKLQLKTMISPQVSQGGDFISSHEKEMLLHWQTWKSFPPIKISDTKETKEIDFPYNLGNVLSGKNMNPFF